MISTHRRRSFLRLLAPFLLLTAGSAATATEAADDLFDSYEIFTGVSGRQTVLPGFFRGSGGAELAVAHRDEGGRGRLRMYALQGGAWLPVVEAELRPGVLFVDVARIGGRDCLITYEHGRINRFDPETAAERELVTIAFDYTEPEEGGIPYADITRDLNGDGRDDLVLPGADGFTVFIQEADGGFGTALDLGPPEPHLEDGAIADDYTYGEMGLTPLTMPWYLGRVHLLDFNRDGRRDVAFWNRDHFDVHLQDEHGRLSPEATIFTTEVAVDSDGEYSLQYGFERKYSRQTALHSFADLNGDGVADLVTMSLEGPGLLGKHTTYRVHFGAPAADATRFSSEADATIVSDGIRRGMLPHDLDGDGRLDLKFSNVKIGAAKIVGAFVTNSFAWDLDFFRMANGTYPAQPGATRRLRGNIRGKNAYSPPVLLGDVNGDGRADLLHGKNRRQLNVFLGVAGPGLFAQQPITLAVATPPDDESSIDVPYRQTRLFDLDRNGKQDLLIDHGTTAQPRRVTVLMAR